MMVGKSMTAREINNELNESLHFADKKKEKTETGEDNSLEDGKEDTVGREEELCDGNLHALACIFIAWKFLYSLYQL